MRTSIAVKSKSPFSSGKERRRFKRYPLHNGLIFADNDNLIGMAKVIDISTCGVRCASLSKINCTICMLKNVELFGAGDDMVITGLSGRMTRCSDDACGPESNSNRCYFEFAFEFSSDHYAQIAKIKEYLSAEE